MVAEVLLSWLNEAYAVEQAQIRLLEHWITAFERYPEIRSELRQHLVETKKQAEDVRECIVSLDGEIQPRDDHAAWLTSLADTTMGGAHNDELVKSMLAIHASEHFEHALYISLSEAARALGEDEIADTCERIADEEAAMAEWAEEHIPSVTTQFMASAREEV